MGVDVIEVYTRPRIAAACAAHGLVEGHVILSENGMVFHASRSSCGSDSNCEERVSISFHWKPAIHKTIKTSKLSLALKGNYQKLCSWTIIVTSRKSRLAATCIACRNVSACTDCVNILRTQLLGQRNVSEMIGERDTIKTRADRCKYGLTTTKNEVIGTAQNHGLSN